MPGSLIIGTTTVVGSQHRSCLLMSTGSQAASRQSSATSQRRGERTKRTIAPHPGGVAAGAQLAAHHQHDGVAQTPELEQQQANAGAGNPHDAPGEHSGRVLGATAAAHPPHFQVLPHASIVCPILLQAVTTYM